MGCLASTQTINPQTLLNFLTFPTVTLLLYFSYPANLLVYGTQAIFQYSENENKPGENVLISSDQKAQLRIAILILNIPFILLSILPNPTSYLWLGIFVVSIFLYTAPIITLKNKPILDSICSGVIFTAPGFVWYFISWWTEVNRFILGAVIVRNMARYAYTLIPNIQTDTQVGAQNTAAWYGKNGTLLFCVLCYLLAAILSFPSLGFVAVAMWGVYIIRMIVGLFNNGFRLFPYFHWLNIIFFLLWVGYLVALKIGRL